MDDDIVGILIIHPPMISAPQIPLPLAEVVALLMVVVMVTNFFLMIFILILSFFFLPISVILFFRQVQNFPARKEILLNLYSSLLSDMNVDYRGMDM